MRLTPGHGADPVQVRAGPAGVDGKTAVARFPGCLLPQAMGATAAADPPFSGFAAKLSLASG
ncbi:hypothetical protein [Streptomyces sp. NPDC004629]|uniref:hypothetical protein n=1 Tax=Streptomyces sp. NPDC004629 TaxID=3364705 RepID=UPI0036A9DF91